MALPSMRYQTSPAKGTPPVEDEDPKKAAIRRRAMPKKPLGQEEELVNNRKQAGY
jgi:hypothetical protein